eukprot:2061058-Prymnesium_polylepis.1
MILSAAAAVGRVWRGGVKVASTKNKAIDYLLLDAFDPIVPSATIQMQQRRPARESSWPSEKSNQRQEGWRGRARMQSSARCC